MNMLLGARTERVNPPKPKGSARQGALRSQGRGCLWGREGLGGGSWGAGTPFLHLGGGGYVGFLFTVTG